MQQERRVFRNPDKSPGTAFPTFPAPDWSGQDNLPLDKGRILAVEPAFHQLDQHNITGDQPGHDPVKAQGRRDKSEEAPDDRERQDTGNKHNQDRADDQGPAWPAVIERDDPCQDNKDNQGLGTDRFDELGSLEEGGVSCKSNQQDEEREEIKERADRAKDHDEFFDILDVPFLWRSDIGFIDIVSRDCGLRNIVKDVV